MKFWTQNVYYKSTIVNVRFSLCKETKQAFFYGDTRMSGMQKHWPCTWKHKDHIEKNKQTKKLKHQSVKDLLGLTPARETWMLSYVSRASFYDTDSFTDWFQWLHSRELSW